LIAVGHDDFPLGGDEKVQKCATGLKMSAVRSEQRRRGKRDAGDVKRTERRKGKGQAAQTLGLSRGKEKS
jgi:hypothetical protein